MRPIFNGVRTRAAAARRDGREASLRRFAWWDYAVFGALTAIQLGVLGTALSRGLRGAATGHPALLILLVCSLVPEIILWESRWIVLPLMRVPLGRPAREGWRVAVAITFVPGVESVEMLEETVCGVLAIRYPHDTWVLDEGNAPEVRALCARLGALHFSRRHLPRYQAAAGLFAARTKYGNYNAWLDAHGYAGYDLVAAFDSDHIPCPSYLDEVLGYFEDAGVAFVQPAQAYYNQRTSFVARAAAEETYAYYSSMQMVAYAVERPLVIGCHNTHRVAAVRSIGGFPSHEADDMAMALRYRASGWRGVYLPQILARGLTPTDWLSYLRQQRRWARSVLDVTWRVMPREIAGLPVLERYAAWLHGAHYLRSVLLALQQLLLLGFLVAWPVPDWDAGAVLYYSSLPVGALLVCEFYRQRFFLDRESEWGLHWRAVFVGFVKWPWLVLATIDAIRGAYGAYVTTAKGPGAPPAREVAVVHGTIAVLISAAGLASWLRHLPGLLPFQLAAGLVACVSAAAATTAWRRSPPSWDAVVRQHWDEVAGRYLG